MPRLLLFFFHEVMFPVHVVVLAALSTFFKAAICGEFKEGKIKSMELNGSSPAAVGVILDFAFWCI